jgi:hypothetical protein
LLRDLFEASGKQYYFQNSMQVAYLAACYGAGRCCHCEWAACWCCTLANA